MNDGPRLPSELLASGATQSSVGVASKLVLTVGVATASLLLPLVAQWEGKSNDPYRDIVGVLTVCYGDTKVPMRRYSDAECSALLEARLADYAVPVLRRNPGLRGRPYQLAPAISLAYNVGPVTYARSSVARAFDRQDWRAGCNAFLRYDFAGGKRRQGLTNRRSDERAICLRGL